MRVRCIAVFRRFSGLYNSFLYSGLYSGLCKLYSKFARRNSHVASPH